MTATPSLVVLSALIAAGGTVVDLGGLKAAAPAAWRELPAAGPMRVKQFMVPPPAGAARAGEAELTVFFFGQGQGGGVEDNMARWKKQFQPPAGKSIEQASKQQSVKLASTTATVLDVQGTYMHKARPMDPGPGEPRPNHRMVAAVLPTPKGNYFLKLVGPEATVAAARADFDRWLRSFK